jgi:ribosome biogenesis GTPase
MTLAAPTMAERSALMQGTVVASHGRHCVVETPDGQRRICHPRGKKAMRWWATM